VTRSFAVIVNPAAGGGRGAEAADPAIAEMWRLGADVERVFAPDLVTACEGAEHAAAAGKVVVAVGGDGLVGPLAGVLMGGAGALAVIPAGRGNDFARVIGIPFDPVEAARLAVEGEERLVDVATANGKPFIGIASLGFDSDANRIANEAKLIRGSLVYLYAALKALAGWRHARFEVTVDGTTAAVTGYTVAVANSKAYGGGMFIAPQAELDDGRLDVMTIDGVSKLRFLLNLPKVFSGAHVGLDNVTFRSGSRIEVSADRPFVVYADGDPVAELPMTVEVHERSLRLIAPPSPAPA
jgi:YegS/Rv2252/BmrU family lipid kinase